MSQSHYVMNKEDYRKSQEPRPFPEKVKGFFRHVWYMSVAPKSEARDKYRFAFNQWYALHKKEEANR